MKRSKIGKFFFGNQLCDFYFDILDFGKRVKRFQKNISYNDFFFAIYFTNSLNFERYTIELLKHFL